MLAPHPSHLTSENFKHFLVPCCSLAFSVDMISWNEEGWIRMKDLLSKTQQVEFGIIFLIDKVCRQKDSVAECL